MAITKILAWRDTDRQDLADMAANGSIDYSMLESIIDDVTELQANLDESEWQDFMLHYHALKRGDLL